MYKKLKDKRKEKNITQEEMAKIIGKKGSTYAKKERGEIPFFVNEANLICSEFNCKYEDIFLN